MPPDHAFPASCPTAQISRCASRHTNRRQRAVHTRVWLVFFSTCCLHEQEEDTLRVDDKGRPIMDSPHGCAMDLVLRYLRLDAHAAVDRDTIAQGLDRMGYRLQDGELDRLCNAIAGDADVLSRAEVVASQLDWRYMQRYQKERWLAIARRTFDLIDEDSDGTVSINELLHALSVRPLPPF